MPKSACPVADLPVYNGTLKREYTECDTWRAAVLDRISREKPAMVVVSDSRFGQLWVDGTPVAYTDREDLWATGLERSLDELRKLTDHVVVIGDTPFDVRCGKFIGAKTLAVATGGAKLDELKALKSDWTVADLTHITAREICGR